MPVCPVPRRRRPDADGGRRHRDRLPRPPEGGGRRRRQGMRVCRDEGSPAAPSMAAEAQAAFGTRASTSKSTSRTPAIEIQILATTRRRYPLGERECSIQRRHQKLIEESPALASSPTRCARRWAGPRSPRAPSPTTNAGTRVPRRPDGNFYFMEMNTRIQVEHPVTEMVTGIDLVKEQIRWPPANPWLPPGGGRHHGHAIEFRVNAEDPDRCFAPPGQHRRTTSPADPACARTRTPTPSTGSRPTTTR